MEKQCVCLSNIQNGAILRSFESETFDIYGPLIQGSTITIRYTSKTKEEILNNNCITIGIKYINDNEQSVNENISAYPCLNCSNGYCASLNLKNNLAICFALPNHETIDLKIQEDKYLKLIDKLNNNDASLPTINDKPNVFSFLLYKIKLLFKKRK